MNVTIVKNDILKLNLIGKTIIHKTLGEGVVVGYSSITGEPFAFFYSRQSISDEVCCFNHGEII